MVLLILGLIAGVLGYPDQYPEPFQFRQVVTDFYGSISIELISIAFTVLILDQMYRRSYTGEPRLRSDNQNQTTVNSTSGASSTHRGRM